MCGAVFPLPYTPLWLAYGKLGFLFWTQEDGRSDGYQMWNTTVGIPQNCKPLKQYQTSDRAKRRPYINTHSLDGRCELLPVVRMTFMDIPALLISEGRWGKEKFATPFELICFRM
jgi:hypothetical protein